MKLEAKKDGIGNIIISKDSFEHLLNCLDNQKFIHELPINGDAISNGKESYYNIQKENQKFIDDFNIACRNILNN